MYAFNISSDIDIPYFFAILFAKFLISLGTNAPTCTFDLSLLFGI